MQRTGTRRQAIVPLFAVGISLSMTSQAGVTGLVTELRSQFRGDKLDMTPIARINHNFDTKAIGGARRNGDIVPKVVITVNMIPGPLTFSREAPKRGMTVIGVVENGSGEYKLERIVFTGQGCKFMIETLGTVATWAQNIPRLAESLESNQAASACVGLNLPYLQPIVPIPQEQ